MKLVVNVRTEIKGGSVDEVLYRSFEGDYDNRDLCSAVDCFNNTLDKITAHNKEIEGRYQDRRVSHSEIILQARGDNGEAYGDIQTITHPELDGYYKIYTFLKSTLLHS